MQTTVGDNRYAVADESTDTIKAFHPVIRSAYDYYPFGMLMPGRYVSDTSLHCLTLSRPQWSWQWVFVNCYDVYEWPWNGFVVVAKGSATKVEDAVSIDLPEPGDGVSFDMAVTPHAAQQLVISAKRIDMNDGGYVQVLEPEGEGWTVLAEAPVGDGENMVIPFIPDYGNIRIAFWGRLSGLFYTICDQKQEWVAEEQLVTICDEDKDKYRWGYNGQEKINEWSGIGNYMDFGERGLDTRIGRFTRVDPLTMRFPWYSPYQFAGNTPIQAIDLDGAEEYHYTRIKDKSGKTTGLSLTKVVDIYEWQWDPRRTGIFTFSLWTRVKNPRKEYIVHQEDRKPMVSDIGVTWDKYDESVAFKTYNEAINSTDADFASTTMDKAHYIVQGIVDVGDESKQGHIPVFKRVKAPKNAITLPSEPYNRRKHYGNTPKQSDRKALGAGANDVVDHKTPLVQHYYEGDGEGGSPGYSMTPEQRKQYANDRNNMQLQSQEESHSQGGKMSNYSKEKKKEYFSNKP